MITLILCHMEGFIVLLLGSVVQKKPHLTYIYTISLRTADCVTVKAFHLH